MAEDLITTITRQLETEYGSPSLGNKSFPIDEIVFVTLTEKTDELKYTAAYTQLRFRFPEWEMLLSAPLRSIESAIRVAGMGKRRAKLLKHMLRAIVARFGSLSLSQLASLQPEEAEEELLAFPGIGRKTARCVLLYCFDFPVLPVDVHTYRLAVRLGILCRRVSYERSHTLLHKAIPEELRRSFHVNAVAHGRARCLARNPKCADCPVKGFCLHPKATTPLPIVVRPKPIAIDLFAGAGGLSCGLRNAGFMIAQAVEIDTHAATTYKRNNPETDVIADDIRRLDPVSCLKRVALRPGDVTVLAGGPPCQGFSESNRRTRNLNNHKNHLYKEYLRFLEKVEPMWFVIENVAGLCTLSEGAILKRIIKRCQALGYTVKWKLLNAADYGVPQFRRRIFIIGNRLNLPIQFPKPTHGQQGKPYVTVRQALNDLPSLENGAYLDCLPYRKSLSRATVYQKAMRMHSNGAKIVQGNLVTQNSSKILKRYAHIGQGQNWEAIPSKLMTDYRNTSLCHTGIYYRLEWDKPSKVIGNFRKNMLIHPEQDRGLSVREAARLQSFPDKNVFLGSIGFQQQQVADAVPPLLAEKIAYCIKRLYHL